METIRADARQQAHRALWDRKPVLREVYSHLYERIAAHCRPGLTVEVGGGSGNFKHYRPDALSFGILPESWLDLVADAQLLPFADATVANIVMLDVLHHIQSPVRFLREAQRVLNPGGRLIFVRPAITPVSGTIYRMFHEEPVWMNVDPLADGEIDPGKDPYMGNQAIPTQLMTRFAEERARTVPHLKPIRVTWLSLFAYPLSGGFEPWSFLSASFARRLLSIEDRLERRLGRVLGFRLFAVLERTQGDLI